MFDPSGVVSRALAWLAPARCAACGASCADHLPLCRPCLDELRPRERTRDVDGIPAWSCARYGGPLKPGIHRFKFENHPHLAPAFARLLLDHVAPKPCWEGSWLVPVPMHPKRLAERGYNHAALLSRALKPRSIAGHQLRAIRRVSDTIQQSRLDRAARLANLDGQFVARRPLSGRRVILVDDVLTTGTTARCCTRALTDAGADVVGILTLAHAD